MTCEGTGERHIFDQRITIIIALQLGFCMKTMTDKKEKAFINICWSEQVTIFSLVFSGDSLLLVTGRDMFCSGACSEGDH